MEQMITSLGFPIACCLVTEILELQQYFDYMEN